MVMNLMRKSLLYLITECFQCFSGLVWVHISKLWVTLLFLILLPILLLNQSLNLHYWQAPHLIKPSLCVLFQPFVFSFQFGFLGYSILTEFRTLCTNMAQWHMREEQRQEHHSLTFSKFIKGYKSLIQEIFHPTSISGG